MKHFFNQNKKRTFAAILVGTFLTGITWQSSAQLLTSDNVTITINTGAQLTVQGDVKNQNGAAINNNGTIDLSGNWIHNSANNCFGVSAGTVIMNGASQTIGGTSSTLFNNLNLTGTGNKTLLINTTTGGNSMGGTLNVGSRNLVLNSKSMTINNPSTSAIAFTTGIITSEQTDNSSKVIWFMDSISGPHTIPFGNLAGIQIPFTFNLQSAFAGNVTVSTYATAANNTPLPVTPTVVTHVRNQSGADNSANMVDRFWQVDPSGTPVANLTFTWASTENAAAGNVNPRGQRWVSPALGWALPLGGQSNPTAQSVTVPNVSAFGPWAVTLASSPLPVKLLEFTAALTKEKETLCKWVTMTEINNDFFTVERSKDGEQFEEVGTVDGAGNSTVVLSYAFTDHNPFHGISYYRLKQTDYDGQFSYSQTVMVNNSEDQFLMYPNPARDKTFLSFHSADDQKVHVSISDMGGRLVHDEEFFSTKGSNLFEVRLESLAKGSYMVQVIANDKVEVKQIMVQ